MLPASVLVPQNNLKVTTDICIIEKVKVMKSFKTSIILPPKYIPNLSAAFGKSPRSTIPKDKFLCEYLPRKQKQA